MAKSVIVRVRLTPEEYEAIKSLADSDQRSLSDWGRLAMLSIVPSGNGSASGRKPKKRAAKRGTDR